MVYQHFKNQQHVENRHILKKHSGTHHFNAGLLSSSEPHTETILIYPSQSIYGYKIKKRDDKIIKSIHALTVLFFNL